MSRSSPLVAKGCGKWYQRQRILDVDTSALPRRFCLGRVATVDAVVADPLVRRGGFLNSARPGSPSLRRRFSGGAAYTQIGLEFVKIPSGQHGDSKPTVSLYLVFWWRVVTGTLRGIQWRAVGIPACGDGYIEWNPVAFVGIPANGCRVLP